MRAQRAIRPIAWALVAAGVAAPVLRRRLRLPPPVVVAAGATAPLALCVAVRRTRARNVALCALNMWAYLAAYEMPNDDPRRLEARVHFRYPIVADRLIGLGVPPTLRLQRRFARPGEINRFERLLAWCHWVWFTVPHGTLVYILLRRPEQFPGAVARMYGVFDTGAVFYWSMPTAPPWWAAERGELGVGPRAERDKLGVDPRAEPEELGSHPTVRVRRMMIEYGPQFWGDRWGPLYDVLGGNPLAAMPSLHFATSVMGAHLLSETGPVAGAVGWTYAALLGLALVYLGEHYAVDLVAGAALTETIRAAAPRLGPAVRALSRRLQALEALAAGS